MSDTLLTIVSKAKELEKSLASLGGELTPEIEEALSQITLDVAEKIDAYDYILNVCKERAASWREVAKDAANTARQIETAEQRIKDRLKYGMEFLGKTDAFGVNKRLKLSDAAPKLIIEDENLIPDSFKITEVVKTINKAAIIETLKNGGLVSGAKLQSNFSIRIYNNTEKK